MHPILFQLGPITIYSYGVMIALAFSVCTFLMWYNAPKFGLPRNKILDFTIILILSGIMGARLMHVILNMSYYSAHPLEIILLTRGGLAFQGGLIAGLACGYIFLKKMSMPVWRTADLITPYIALGQAVGRIGCLLNGCCYGKILTDHPFFGITFPMEAFSRFPTQILSSFILLFIYMLLRIMLQKNILKNNLIFAYLMFYSMARFFIDFLRADMDKVMFGLTASQLISIGVFIFAFSFLVLRSLGGYGKE